MQIYIASTLSNFKTVRAVATTLASLHGITLTYDWTPHGEAIYGDNAKSRDPDIDLEQVLHEVSGLELKGVEDAQAVLAITPMGNGTHVEIGYAHGLGKPLVLYQGQVPKDRPVSFHYNKDMWHLKTASEHEAITAIVELTSRVTL